MPLTRVRECAWSPPGSSDGPVSRADVFEMYWAAEPVLLQDRRVMANRRDKVGVQVQKVV